MDMVNQCKEYSEDPKLIFHGQDYKNTIQEYRTKFDLMPYGMLRDEREARK